MNQTQAEAALTQVLSEYDAGAAWHPLGTVAILFIAACQQPKEPGGERRPPHDPIDKWLLERELTAIRKEKEEHEAVLQRLGDSNVEFDARIVRAIAQTEKEFDARIARAIAQYDRRASAVRSWEERETYGRRILDWLDLVDLTTPEGRRRAAGVFEDAVRFAVERHGKHLGVFVTPEPVARLMLELAELAPGQTVYDPCFGLGEILVGAGRRLSEDASDSQRMNAPHRLISGCDTHFLAYCVTRCRLVLTGIDNVGLELEDALTRALPGEGAAAVFDRVLAAPPWGKESIKSPHDHWSKESVSSQYEHFPFPSVHAEDLFLQHVMAHLQPGGRAVVALPERTLVHAESSALRKELLSRYRVEGVVALPPGAFEPCTSISMNLVVFSRVQPRETVRFVTVSPVAWDALPAEPPDRDEGAVGSGRPSPRFADGELDNFISRMIGSHRELSAGQAPAHVQSWVVPVQDLILRDYELIAKKSGSETLDTELGRLVETDRSLPVKRLDEVAELRTTGVREGLPDDYDGLLRPADVTDVKLRQPSGTIDANDLLSVEPRDYLRTGDLVVPMSETIGNIGLVKNVEDLKRYEGVVADRSIAVVRVHEGIKLHFLTALLRSPAYWFWLSGHATGSTNASLSPSVLSTLRVPVPPLSVQDAVLEELGTPRADALAVLYRLLSGMARHPVAVWLEGPLAASLAAGERSNGARGMDTLAKLAAEIRSLAKPPAAPTAGDGAIGRWLAAARRAAASLDDLDSVPEGSGRLAVLEFAAAKLREALGALDRAEAPLGERLRSVTRGLVGLVEEEVHAMQRRCRLDIAVPAEVLAGAIAEVRLRVTNPSPVPLRKVRVTARQADRRSVREVPYLAEGQQHEFPLVVRAQDDTRPLHIDVAWQARRLDATPVEGRTKVSVPVRSGDEAAATGDLGASPYIVGNPVDRDEMFFGRDGIMDQIRRQLGGEQANVILLEGNRRTGKTSILQQLRKEEALPGWVPVYCSFQDLDSMATSNVFRLLARRTGLTLADAGIETWIPDAPPRESGRPFKLAFLAALRGAFSGDHPYDTLALYLSTAIEAAKPRRVLLMLDEFDKLQEGIDGGITSPQVPENIRHLLQHQSGLGAILTGSRRLKRLREEYWSALFGFGHRVGVSALPEEDARRLVTEPVARRIRYLPQARDRLVALCARHPFLIQSLCSRVFDQAAAGSERIITGELVDRAATEMVRDNEHFQTLWGYAGSERRRLILALSDRMEDAPDAFNRDLIGTKFEEYRVPVGDDKALVDDITELRELELLEIDESYRGGTYRLTIPLMAKWRRMNVDFDDLVERARQEAIRHA